MNVRVYIRAHHPDVHYHSIRKCENACESISHLRCVSVTKSKLFLSNWKSHRKCKGGRFWNIWYLFLFKRHKNWYNVFNGMLFLYSTLKVYHNFNLVNLYWRELIKKIMYMSSFRFRNTIIIIEIISFANRFSAKILYLSKVHTRYYKLLKYSLTHEYNIVEFFYMYSGFLRKITFYFRDESLLNQVRRASSVTFFHFYAH